MSLETLEQILREIDTVCAKPVSMLWYGGEPTLYGLSKFTQAVERSIAVLGDVRHSIQTNGALIDASWSRLFRTHRFGVTVSLDGPPALHDVQRTNCTGKATHSAVMRGIRCMQEAGLSPRVACVVTAKSLPHAAEIVEYLASLGVAEVDFPPAMRLSSTGDLEPFVTPEEYADFLVQALHCWIRIDRPDFRIRSVVGLARRLKGLPGHYCKLEGDCSTYVTFSTGGDVYPCDEFSGPGGTLLGSLKNQSLEEILSSGRCRYLFREWTRTPENCLSCEWQSVCLVLALLSGALRVL